MGLKPIDKCRVQISFWYKGQEYGLEEIRDGATEGVDFDDLKDLADFIIEMLEKDYKHING
jgi:hypothetical protein